MKRISLTSLLFFIITPSLFISCKSEPGVQVDDPKAYLMDYLRTAEIHSWWAEYADRSDAFLSAVVDRFEQSLPDELPTDSKKLDRLKPRALGRYSSMMLAEPYRDHIMQEAQRRFENPPMALVGKRNHNIGLLDFHWLPGTWGKIGRSQTEVITKPPAVTGLRSLDHGVFVDALNRVAKRFPNAFTYQIRADYNFGASHHQLTIQVARNGNIVMREGVFEAFTAEPVDWDRLVNGDIELDKLEWDHPMEVDAGPGFNFVHKEPLPMQ